MARAVARSLRATALPLWFLPQLTQLVNAAPDGDQWLHEVKYDGYRMHARLDRGVVKLLARTGLDWTYKYPAIAKAVAALDARQAYLDGELCGVGPDGTTSFNIVQLASDSGNAAALMFFLFDLLYLDGEDLRSPPLIERKERLRTLLASAAPCLKRLTTLCEAIRARARGLDSLSGRDNTASGHQHGLFFEPIGFSLRTVGRLPQNHISKNMTCTDGFGYDGPVLEIV
jgi:ATP-dependent DNA ligase